MPNANTTPQAIEILKKIAEWSRKQGKIKGNQSTHIVIPVIRPPAASQRTERHKIVYDSLPSPTSIRCIKLELIGSVTSEFDIFRPIQCSLITTNLDQLPHYDALSYTWGDPLTIYSGPSDVSSPEDWSAETFDIYCHGRPFSVTSNLYAALLTLRWRLSMEALGHRTSSTLWTCENDIDQKVSGDYEFNSLVWIDQICIDQANSMERSRQVLLMNRIYRQAGNVLVWLGGEDNFTLDAFDAMQSLATMKIDTAKELVGLNILQPEMYQKIGMPSISVEQWLGLWSFLNRSWFRRAWIIQEVAVAKTVTFLAGSFSFDFPILAATMTRLKESLWIEQLVRLSGTYLSGEKCSFIDITNKSLIQAKDTPVYEPSQDSVFDAHFFLHIMQLRATCGITSKFWTLTEEPEGLPHLQTLVTLFRHTRATDPRDKIYAFLGMSRELLTSEISKPGLSIVPDYEKSPQAVYVEAATYFLLSSGRLDCLGLKEAQSTTNVKGLPSWVPDFTAVPPSPLVTGPWPWSAGDTLGSAHIRISETPKLELRGFKVGVLRETKRVAEVFEWGMDTDSLVKFLRMIPEFSDIINPVMTPKLRQTLRKIDIPEHQQWRTSISEHLEDEGLVRRQSRFEIFWRTVLRNCFNGNYPAPSACGKAIIDEMEARVYSFIIGAVVGSKKQFNDMKMKRIMETTADMVGAHGWEHIKKKIGVLYSAILSFRGERPYESEEIAYPPVLSRIMVDLESAWRREEWFAGILPYVAEINEKRREIWETSKVYAELKDRIAIHNLGKNLIVTTGGLLGTANASAKAGDEVWVLSGGSIPFILRADRDRCYHLISDTYVHGIMHGEAVLDKKSSDMTTIVLV